MRRSGWKVVVAALPAGIGSGAFAQTTIYQTGFESPPFIAGVSLQGLDAWLIQSTPQTPMFAIAQTTNVLTGAQAAEVQSSLVTGSSWAWKDVNFNPITAGTPIVTVSWDMKVAAGATTQAGIDFYSLNPFGRLMALGVNATGVVNYLIPPAAAFVNTNTTLPFGQWASFKVTFNYTTSKLDIAVNGATIASGLAFPAGTDFGDADLWKGGAGTAHIYYDNLKIVAAASAGCYPDCDGNGQLTIADFGCFQTKFVQSDPYADCDGNGLLTIADFGCFQTKFVQGCL